MYDNQEPIRITGQKRLEELARQRNIEEPQGLEKVWLCVTNGLFLAIMLGALIVEATGFKLWDWMGI